MLDLISTSVQDNRNLLRLYAEKRFLKIIMEPPVWFIFNCYAGENVNDHTSAMLIRLIANWS